AGGLVHDEDVIVLVHHRERDVLGRHVLGCWGRHAGLDLFARLHAMTRLDPAAVDRDESLLDERLDSHAGQVGEPRVEPEIEAGPGILRPDRIAEPSRREAVVPDLNAHRSGAAVGQTMRNASSATPTVIAESATLKAGQW